MGLGALDDVYTAGPQGIREGGSLFVIVPAFWGWSGIDLREPDRPGWTEARTDAAGVEG